MTAMRTAPVILSFLLLAAPAPASDWPQFMRDSAHTGDAVDEALVMPLGLIAQVKLDDAVMTSPAVVGGLAYVVDQMGTAYCIDPKAGRIVWKASPDGDKVMGSNTSSPCVAKGWVYYGTAAGAFRILDCKDGKTVKAGRPVHNHLIVHQERRFRKRDIISGFVSRAQSLGPPTTCPGHWVTTPTTPCGRRTGSPARLGPRASEEPGK